MAKTYAQLQRQIGSLEIEAEALKRAEVAGVIGRVMEAIAAYGLTMTDLFGGKAAAQPSKKKGGGSRAIKYADGTGNVWVGVGKRPDWLRAALLAGRSLEEFAVKRGGAKGKSNGTAVSVKKSAAKKQRKGKGRGTVKFRDGVGNSWTGFGVGGRSGPAGQ